jgi:hypothetical protein
MNAVTYLQNQLANVHTFYQLIVKDFTDEEWTRHPAPGQNLVGFTAWHIPRTQDAHVQTFIRGIPEVAHRKRWMRWQSLKVFGNGVGVSFDEADRIARSVSRLDVMEYANAVHQEIMTWLGGLSDHELDYLPDIALHLSNLPEYHTAGFIEEAGSLFDQPTWSQLMRPCIGHVYRHLGELEVVKGILNARQSL